MNHDDNKNTGISRIQEKIGSYVGSGSSASLNQGTA